MRTTMVLALSAMLAMAGAGCTRTQVGGGLLALGAGAGYEGTGLALGGATAIGKEIDPEPRVGVPLLLSGVLAGGIGISLIAIGDEHGKAAKPKPAATATQVGPEGALVVYPKPRRLDPLGAVPGER